MYKHKEYGYYLRMIRQRESGINTYLIIDKDNNPVLKVPPWSNSKHKKEQHRIIKGFDKLVKL